MKKKNQIVLQNLFHQGKNELKIKKKLHKLQQSFHHSVDHEASATPHRRANYNSTEKRLSGRKGNRIQKNGRKMFVKHLECIANNICSSASCENCKKP